MHNIKFKTYKILTIIIFFLNSVILFLFIKKRFINTWNCITMKHKKKGLERSKPFSV